MRRRLSVPSGPGHSHIGAERLEPRLLMTAGPVQLVAPEYYWEFKDVAVAGDTTFLLDAYGGLSRTDGSQEGTESIPGVRVPIYPIDPMMVTLGDYAYFPSFIGTTNYHAGLWRSDGTEAGTTMVVDLGSSGLSNLTELNGQLFFVKLSVFAPAEVWTSDGTEAGTVKLADLYSHPGPNDQLLFPSGDVLYFRDGGRLLRTDGTTEGTQFLFGTASLQDLIPANGKLLFLTDQDWDLNRELWQTNGTVEGTVRLKEESPSWRFIGPATSLGSKTYFAAQEDYDSEPWVTDGTAAGTVRLKDINFGSNYSEPSGFQVLDGTVYFFALGLQGGMSIWTTDGTEEGTISLTEPQFGVPTSSLFLDGRLYFTAPSYDDDAFATVWQSDFTPEGTFPVGDIGDSIASPTLQPRHLVANGDMLYFIANRKPYVADLRTPGDATNDGLVDGGDYVVWADHFLTELQSTLTFSQGDFNRDGLVDGADYILWSDHFTVAPAMTVAAHQVQNFKSTITSSPTAIAALSAESALDPTSPGASAHQQLAWAVSVDGYFSSESPKAGSRIGLQKLDRRLPGSSAN